ncbi:hypothetical protein TWF718_006028 [Orbilia javanica]|uniref:Uncharacterized protein n=1 Tax=Orbilia javanica TaxID=47235 RepID=A0AAN8RJW5_9PEZI
MSPQEYHASPFYAADQVSLQARRAAEDPFGEKDTNAIGDHYKDTVHWPSKNSIMKEKRLLRMKDVLEQRFRDSDGVEMDLSLFDVEALLEQDKEDARAEDQRKRAEEARKKRAEEASGLLPIFEAKSGLQVANARMSRGAGRGGSARGRTPMRRITAGKPRREQLEALPTDTQTPRPSNNSRKKTGGGRHRLFLPQPLS